MDALKKRVSCLERDQYALQYEQRKHERTLVDLQCRMMKDNLIFISIDEVVYSETSEYENVEQSLIKFLEEEMGIRRPIEFARVHRLGIYDKDTAKDNPRQVIAKFERFKDREYVRSLAPETLRGKKFGIREQYSKTVEEKRKSMYPVAKEARKNTDNKVRLVRDKLYIDNEVIIVETSANSEISAPSAKSWSKNIEANATKRNPWQNTNRTEHHIEGNACSTVGRSETGI